MKKQKLWCCVGYGFKGGSFYDWSTLSFTRRDSIKKMTGNYNKDAPLSQWAFWKKKHWDCVKVTVEINPISNNKQRI